MDHQQAETRMTVVDALRGFALISIMLLHNIEVFEVHGVHPLLPEWVVKADKVILDSFFFLFAGKSYAIFALLFGLTFYIQTRNQAVAGNPFRFRFMWRMCLLLGFGLVNTLFYRGEILVMYALLGSFLIPFQNRSNQMIFGAALICLFQPVLWFKLIVAVQNPTLAPAIPSFMPFYIKSGPFLTGDSMFQLMKSNITDGRIASLLWLWEYGRVEQTLGLFLLGLLAGRKRVFYNTPENIKFWKYVLKASFLVFIPLYFLKSNPEIFSASQNIAKSLGAILTIWANLAFMLVLISSFLLLFYHPKYQPSFNRLAPIGKMSLTNYILQSIVGASIYYGFGFGMYRYAGATYCLVIGILLTFAMGFWSRYWMSQHQRGFLETIWHQLTWLGTHKEGL
jgi:uncharacterized protein